MTVAYDTIEAWVLSKVAEISLDGSSSGAHTTDVVLNVDTLGHAHVGAPADYRQVRLALTASELVDYYCDVHYRVAGDEAATAAKANAFADSIRTKMHHIKGVVGGGLTHNDTEVTFPEHVQGAWDKTTLERKCRYRVRVNITETLP